MDASWLWKNEQLSDARIRWSCTCSRPEHTDACNAPSAKVDTAEQPGCMELSAHTAVLASVSEYWKARILRWEQGGQPDSSVGGVTGAASKAMVIEENVDSTESLQAVHDVLCYMYCRQFTPDVSVALLLQMTIIADKWGAQDVVAACLQEAASSPDLTVNDVIFVLNSILAEDIAVKGALEHVRVACGKHLLAIFGRAQEMVTSPNTLQAFCNLSLQGVQIWAEQDALKVDSENTVAVLFTHWWDHNSPSFSTEQAESAARTLTGALRACSLSRSYVLCVLDTLPWFRASKQAVWQLRMLHDNRRYDASFAERLDIAWGKDPHEVDKHQLSTLLWAVTRADLDQLHKDASEHTATLESQPLYWRGYTWQMCLELQNQQDELSLYIKYAVAMPAGRNQMMLPVLPAVFDLAVDTSRGKVATSHTYDSWPLTPWYCFGRHVFLQVDKDKAPRANSYPPDHLWHTDGKLHLGLFMKSVSQVPSTSTVMTDTLPLSCKDTGCTLPVLNASDFLQAIA